ncbi:MAG TPA: ATP-grasp domain-containing protein [Acidobacteriaceae bacterium]|jgi:predicted ATP-grasp superfamily ATP-dependent carboligase|nr:ATP-grasp domain-containing protein [Acidobacteriaceae bacterium]
MAAIAPPRQKSQPNKPPVPAPSSSGPAIGALVVGGDHPGLAVVRSLGRRGIPVCVVDHQACISRVSRYATRVVRVPDILDERKTVDAVLDVGRRFDLRNWVLIPTRDETVAAFSRYRDELAAFFSVTTGEWDSVQWAWDKNKTYQLAESLGIPCPQTFNPRTSAELDPLIERLPLALKPAVKENFFYATGAKAWRADTPAQLHEVYERASRQIKPEEILIQEIIPGSGQEQYSWCAFVQQGRPHSTLCARRLRQHPREFGRAATYVETIDAPEIEELSERFVRAIRYHGLVEIEYKRDPRDGQYKLLDVNARAWGFHGLGAACGVDFPWLLFADRLGLPIEPVRAPAGVGWLRLITDVPTALSDLTHGYLTLGEYFRSLRATGTESVFAASDPLPWLAEVAMLPFSILKKYPLFSRKKA